MSRREHCVSRPPSRASNPNPNPNPSPRPRPRPRPNPNPYPYPYPNPNPNPNPNQGAVQSAHDSLERTERAIARLPTHLSTLLYHLLQVLG